VARSGSKRIAEDFTNDGLSDALEYLHKKGWHESGAPATSEGFKGYTFEDNRNLLDRLVQKMRVSRELQSQLDYRDLMQWVRNYRRNRSKAVRGISSLSCDLSQGAYGELLKLVKRTNGSQRSVVENLLLEGETMLRGEVKLLRDDKKEQSRRLQEREGRIRKIEGRLEKREKWIQDQEKEIAEFKRRAQPILDLLFDFGHGSDSKCIDAFKPILEALYLIGKKEGADLMVRDVSDGPAPKRYSKEEKQLNHHLFVLMNALRKTGVES